MAAYDDAVAELHQAPHEAFVGERKRLAAALKAAGDKDGAARLAKLPRPPISAWTVNQLWWHARDAFDALFATAATVRAGDLGASGAHREALAKLRARAARILGDAGHGATEATLRRITQTLAALAASGSWDPDPPGTLAADRDPPGFEALGIASHADAPHATHAAHAIHAKGPHAPRPRAARDELAEARRAEHEREERERAAAAAERRRIEEERARLRAERHRLEAALRTARGDLAVRERERDRLRTQLASADNAVDDAQREVDKLEAALEELGN